MAKLSCERHDHMIEHTGHAAKFYQRFCYSILVWIIVLLPLLAIVSCAPMLTSNKYPTIPSQVDSMDPNNIESMVWQSESFLWISNRDGIGRLNRANNHLDIFTDIKCADMIITGNYGHVWCSGAGNVYRYDGISWDRFEIEAYQVVESNNGILWAGTRQGMSRFDEKEQKWVPVLSASEIAPHFVFSTGPGIHLAFAANDDALWFYSFSEPYVGTTRWTEASYQTWLPAGKWIVVQPKLEAQDSTVWGIGDKSVIAQWNGQTWQVWQPFRLEPAIRDLVKARDGSIWVLAAADGVGQWDDSAWKIWTRDETILQNCPGTADGKECFSANPDITYYPADGLGKPDSTQARLVLTALLETHDGNIWVGTAQEGISRWDGNRWYNYTIADGLSSEAITVLKQSPDGVLWVGTWGGGVNYYDPSTDRWQPFPWSIKVGVR